HKNLVDVLQRVADDVEAFAQQFLVEIDVGSAAEIERGKVALDVGAGDVDVIRLRHTGNALEDALGRGSDQQLRQTLVLLQSIGDGDAAEFPFALAVGAPHRTGNVLAADRLDYHRTGLLHDPHEGVGDLQDVALGQILLAEQTEPVVGDGV